MKKSLSVYVFLVFLTLVFTSNCLEAQIFKKKKSEKELLLETFSADDSTSALEKGRFTFPNIGKIDFYRDEVLMRQINKLKRDEETEQLYAALYTYINRFGTRNFADAGSADVLWYFARLSEYLGKTEMTKEVYRLLIRHYRGDLAKAILHYDSLTEFDKDLYVNLEDYYKMLDLRAHIDTLKPPRSVLTALSGNVNSPMEEYGVTISQDNLTLIFTSRRNTSKEYIPGATSELNEDLYFSLKRGEDWDEVKPLYSLNTPYNEGSPCISHDGKYIFFSRCYSPDGFGDCDLYFSEKVNDTLWSEAKNLGEAVNSASWDSHPSVSPTGDTLYFSSDRLDGFGGTDIYYSIKKGKRWGKAQNIGPVINTRRNEVSPFIHPMQSVLYFSSDGQIVNFGDFDIYKSYPADSMRWSEPINTGPLVNGKGSEFYFAIDSEAQKLFYARSEADTPKNLDLFSFPLPMGAQPNAIVRFSGRVTEESTGEVFSGVVTILDLEDRIEIAPKNLHSDGSFHFDLIKGKKYMLIVQGDNFFRIEEVFFLDQEKNMNVQAKSIQTIRFQSIEFESGKSELRPEMENDLHLVIDFLIEHPDFVLKISGHTDSGGNEEFNLRLSRERAENIRDYVVAYGRLDPERVEAFGKGSSEPIVPTEISEEDKRLNRRVEFRLLRRE